MSQPPPVEHRYRPLPVAEEWASALNRWAASLTVTRSTLAGYRQHVAWLARAFSDRSPWDVTAPVLQELLDGQLWSRATRSRATVSWRSFYAWGVARGHLHRSPAAGLGSHDRRRPGPRRRPQTPDWEAAISEFLTWLQAAGRSTGTLARRREHIANLAMHVEAPWSVTGDDLSAWLSTPDLAAETRRARRSSVRLFYRWASLTGRIARDPAQELAAVRVPRALPRPITQDALSSALADADDRQRLALLLAALAGLRRAEIAGLSFDDVRDGQLRITGKGGHVRLVPLHPLLAAELSAEQERRRGGHHGSGWGGPYVRANGPVFPSCLHPGPLTPAHLAKIVRPLLPDSWTLHTIRHRFATQAYAAERDLRTVQELLGHSKPEVTARYAAVPDAAKRTAVAAISL